MVKTVNFFECYNPTTGAQRLELPAVFRLQLQGDLPERAFLRVCYTNLWPIKMAKIGNDCFFLDGWEKFVADNSLELGDILVFQYDGDNLFDVKLLGLSCCDKEGLGHFHMSVEDKNEDGQAEAERDEGEEGIHDSDDNAEVYKEIMEVRVEDTEDEDDTEKLNMRLKKMVKQKRNKWLMVINVLSTLMVMTFSILSKAKYQDGQDNELLQFLQSYNQLKKIGDVLVFQYDGDNLFDVKPLGLSGCDKEGLGHVNMSVEDKNEDGRAEAEQVVVDGASKEDDVESSEDLYYMESEDNGEEGIHGSDDNAEVYMEIVEDEDEDDEYEDGKEDDNEYNEDVTKVHGEAEAEQVADGRPGQRHLNSYGNDIFNSI
ncbi:unnamed protein product [Fraxinus pennsylvanica]|uniref:TF-B3 domain-containing protein n=1 Tax=Fraxinus pennsylvanica TaxID=56036 RepID=A0AAD2AJV7_9LAMI|nr:unnamed protein product [Fraxinus pennsylvanica]